MTVWISSGLIVRLLGNEKEGFHRIHDAAAGRAENALFGFGKAGEIGASGEFLKLAEKRLPAGIESGGGGPERGSGLVAGAWLRATGVGEERLAGADVGGGAEGGEEGFGLARREAVALCGVGEFDLLAGGERAQARGEREGDGAGVETMCERLRQATSEQQATLDPAFLAVEQSGNVRRRASVFLDERGHDADFVHRADRSWGAVGEEDPGLGGGTRVRFDHDRDLLESIVFPLSEALEAVENFVGAIGGAEDADGQRGQVLTGVRAGAAEVGERRAQRTEGNVEDFGHGHLPAVRRKPQSPDGTDALRRGAVRPGKQNRGRPLPSSHWRAVYGGGARGRRG